MFNIKNMEEEQFKEMQRAVMSMNGKKSWEARVKKHGKKGALKKLKEYSHSRKKLSTPPIAKSNS